MFRYVWLLFVCFALLLSLPAAADVADAGSSDAHAEDILVADPATTEEGLAPELGVPSVDELESITEAAGAVLGMVNSARTGAWLLLVIGLLQLIIFSLKRVPATQWVVKEYGGLIVVTLSGVASLLLLITGGATLPEALLVFGAAAGTKYVHDILHEIKLLRHTPAEG